MSLLRDQVTPAAWVAIVPRRGDPVFFELRFLATRVFVRFTPGFLRRDDADDRRGFLAMRFLRESDFRVLLVAGSEAC
jgi:hypothetical protein